MGGRGQNRFVPRALHYTGDFGSVGCDHEAIADASVGDSPDDPKDERFACQRQEWLARKPAGAQPCRNHAKDGHGGTYKIRAVASSPDGNRLSGRALTRYAVACATLRKLSSSCLPCSVPMDSGMNCT